MARPRSRRGAVFLLSCALAAGCGFEPVHGKRTGAAPAAGIVVDALPGPAGFAMRERLLDRLGAADVPVYRLSIDLRTRQEGAAITQDSITTRYVMLGTADFSLVPVGGDAPAIQETVTARTAFSTPASDTVTIFAARAAALAAEERLARTLADRIVLRLALAGAARPGP
jgi:LPS-assembly lipoprotein